MPFTHSNNLCIECNLGSTARDKRSYVNLTDSVLSVSSYLPACLREVTELLTM